MNARSFLAELITDSNYRQQLVCVRTVEPREARYAEPAVEMPQELEGLLRRSNIHRLYTHQAAAVDAAAAGKDFVVVTGTASGKTLCYNLPVVSSLLGDDDARALYLFPTKALTQDQHGTLARWAAEEGLQGRLRPAVYDGDTPPHNRAKIRSEANCVLTNPDMLHVGMLPYHAKWHRFLANLRYVVIDELHVYRGIFGSHVAGVLRRLFRLCEHYGSRPQVVASSATIGNPVELAERLTGRAMELINDDGAPRGRKYVALWNPPMLAEDNVSRRSANVEAVDVLTQLVRRRAQTIVFGKARIVVELVYRYATESLEGESDLAERIRPYRGGYLPSERRQIEQKLFSGELLAVAATNALELGIDVGALDAAVLVGFPGTICSFWQQAGRAGRTGQDSLVLLVAYNEAIDQYLMRHPEYLFDAVHEHSVIDPSNPHILAGQIGCACFEKPLTADDEKYFGPLAPKIAELLAEEGQAKPIDGRYYWRSNDFAAGNVNLRMISSDTYAIVDKSAGGAVLGNVDSISAPELVYPGAVYLHEGKSYLVDSLDPQAKVAAVRPVEVDYYTQPVLSNHCRLFDASEQRPAIGGPLAFGPCEVTWQTTAYRKFKYYTMEMIGQDELLLPSQTLATTGMWWTPDKGLLDAVRSAGFNPVEGLIGVRNLMLASLPALAMCDRRDVSGQVESANLGRSTAIIYDRYPGGMGFAQLGYDRFEEWLALCRQIVAECPCVTGCPSCVGLPNLRPPIHGDPDLDSGYPVPSKGAAMRLLNYLEQELTQPSLPALPVMLPPSLMLPAGDATAAEAPGAATAG